MATDLREPRLVPDPVRDELDRLAERWRQLPLDQALGVSEVVLATAQRLADEVAARTGMPPAHLPDLGPAVVLDQLRVQAYDAVQAAMDGDLADRLAQLRRALP
ncbi:MAG: hypothetical protein WAR57_13330 [Candidatus Phosphoribacter sp.]|nr:hypothetical protein [Actinomycetales bacterium]